MPRPNRHYIPGVVWHTLVKWASHLTGQVTHRCHKKEFLLKFARDRRGWLRWLFEAKKRFGLSVLNYMVTSNHIHLLLRDNGAKMDSRGSEQREAVSGWKMDGECRGGERNKITWSAQGPRAKRYGAHLFWEKWKRSDQRIPVLCGTEGVSQGKQSELLGGGLVRSLGGWSQVLSLRRTGGKVNSDDRILGSSEFVRTVLFEAEEKVRETLRLNRKITDLKTLPGEICEEAGIEESDPRSGSRMKPVAKARKLFAQIAVKKMGYGGAEAARFLGVTTSAVNRLPACKALDEVKN